MKRIAALSLAAFGALLLPGRAAEPVADVPEADDPSTTGLFSRESGSFEWPAVTGSKTLAQGANMTKAAMNNEWQTFKDKPDIEGGQLVLGLTNRLARTGRQCLFVEFNNLTKPNTSTLLSSTLLPILPGKPYHVSIWGRMDKERPITLAQRSPLLKLRVDWFTAGTEEEGPEQTGVSVWKIQPIPGPKHRKPFFVADQWKEYFANMKSPEDAAFAKITWYWDTPLDKGMTDGVIYFDDAGLYGESGPKEDPLADLEKDGKAAEAKEGAAPATPSAPAAPAPTAPKASSPPKDGIETVPLR